MTIRKGEPWGSAGPLGTDEATANSDRELRTILEPILLADAVPAPVGLLAGDLARTCGATGDSARLRSPDAQHLPIDVIEVETGGRTRLAVAHVVVRNDAVRGGLWRGRIVAAMNAQFIGAWDIAPRSHPNDGRIDLFDADLAFGDRVKAWRRLPLGTHVPHPDIQERRVKTATINVEKGSSIYVDGERIEADGVVELRVRPDAATIVV